MMSSQVNMDLKEHKFVAPTKQVSQQEDIPTWEKSQAYADLMGFIGAMNESVKDVKISDNVFMSPNTERLVKMLETINQWIDDIPPIDQPQRFGNKAFKTFYERLVSESAALLESTVESVYQVAIPEIKVYLTESFGNSTRIDYGTGHELSFVAFLCCLYKIGVLEEKDAQATVLRLFQSYLEICRKLQRTYNMEPAGSHGVWSLDDFQFIPFIWGSSQLLNHKRITPAKFVQEDYFQNFYKDYMFLGCIKFICSVKTGPFAEHSNQLWNISGVPLWSKVNSGLIKMYKAEVLSKFPVIQHFLFGSILTLNPIH